MNVLSSDLKIRYPYIHQETKDGFHPNQPCLPLQACEIFLWLLPRLIHLVVFVSQVRERERERERERRETQRE